MPQEVQQHLKDHLFHRVHKHIRDLTRYLYSNLGTTYSQLMIAACKVESENEEAHDKVRARSAMTTDPVEGTTELGNQIAKLMGALTRGGQGNSPSSTPNSPRQSLWERTDGQEHSWSPPAPTMVKLAWGRPPQPAVYLLVTVQGPQIKARDKIPKGPKIAREALHIRRIPAPSNASGSKVRATWLGNVPPQQRL